MSSIRHKRMGKEWNAEYSKEVEKQEFEKNAPIREATQRLSETHAQLIRAEQALALQTLLSEPSEDLAKSCVQFKPDPEQFQTAEQVQAAIVEAWNAFRLAMESKGVTVHSAAQVKFAKLFSLNPSVDSRAPKTFQVCYEIIDRLNGWSDREVTKPTVIEQSVQVPEPERTRADILNDIEMQETTTREGERKARRLAIDGWVADKKPLFKEFIAHMRSVWQHPMVESDQTKVTDFCYDSGLGITAKSLDLARQQVLGCLTADETLAAEISQSSDKLTDNWSNRRAIAERIKELQH